MNTMRSIALSGSLIAAALGTTACAHKTPDALAQARQQYQEAAAGPASKYAPAELASAKESLDDAEKAFEEDDESQQAFDLAYVADRKARLATTKAGIAMTEQQDKAVRDQAIAERDRLNAAQRQQLASAQMQSDEAQRRAREAELALQNLGAKQSERGQVITLQGNVLFQTGKANLLPGAKQALDQVAAVLVNMRDRQLIIDGYTDSRGSDELNQRLSEARANSVRDYLVSQGVNADQLRAEGLGESAPIADNGTAEGRAMNRRVEIVVGNPSNTMGASNQNFNR
jgi:outer membrane protein OmpA-like peptidoglycan-associated protein